MKELRKRFETEQDNLRSFITCACPNIQCACNNLGEASIARESDKGYTASYNDQSSYYNR